MTTLKRCHADNQLQQLPNPELKTAVTTTGDNDILQTRLGKCEVCDGRNALYTCPKCEVKTCCVTCSKIHKRELECDGIRDRTKYIPLKKMSKIDFMSDYRFLEECTRYVADRKYDKLKRFTRYNKLLPTHLFKLRNAAGDRKIFLKFVTEHFTKHLSNTTFYDWKTKVIYWRVEWLFPNAGNLLFIDERCSEREQISQLLDKYLNPNSNIEVFGRKKLEFYQSKGLANIKVLLKSEGIKKCKNRYYELDIHKSLNTNLSGKTLVEFPCIFIVYNEVAEEFDIIDSDEDVESEAKNYRKILDETYRRNLELEDNKKNIEVAEDEVVVPKEKTAEDKLKEVEKEVEEKRLERERKREQYKKEPRNFLFTDENTWELSSTDSDGNETEEDVNGTSSLDHFFSL